MTSLIIYYNTPSITPDSAFLSDSIFPQTLNYFPGPFRSKTARNKALRLTFSSGGLSSSFCPLSVLFCPLFVLFLSSFGLFFLDEQQKDK
ncbi:hypothetical protein NQZ68_035656 [Dissostichus eleginoides]|nr:hypothetical protein NQZ68_035656 [Dissostichus eleginoides]